MHLHIRTIHISYIFTVFTLNRIIFTDAANTTAVTDSTTGSVTTLLPSTNSSTAIDSTQTTIATAGTTLADTTLAPTTAGAFNIDCDTNTCPTLTYGRTEYNPRCLKRQAPSGPSFVCECPSVTRSDFGFTCDRRYYQDFGNSDPLITCYGPECRTGSTWSHNYPKDYRKTRGGTMTLVYVPGAFRFDLSFADPFEIELYKDDLWVGDGLAPPFGSTPGPPAEKEAIEEAEYFNGYSRPKDFKIEGDSMWIWFSYDNSISYRGFNLTWEAVAIEIDCPSGRRRVSLPDDSDLILVREAYPPTRYGVSDEYITVESTFPPEKYLGNGTYTVEYSVSDNFGNSERCDHQLIVEDTTAPEIVFCPDDYELIGVCSAQDANLTEPMAIDNLDGEIVAKMSSRVLREGPNDITYIFEDYAENMAVCRVTVGIYCMPPTQAPPQEFPLWAVFVAAGVAVLILLLILAVFANAKLSAAKAARQADLSFNPEEYTGHKPGAPLEEAPPPPGQEKIGMYSIQP